MPITKMKVFNLLLSVFMINYVKGDCEVETETLCVNQVNEDGFGDPNNQYAWAMTTFKGELIYVQINHNEYISFIHQLLYIYP